MFEIGVMLNNLERDRHCAWALAPQMGFRLVHTNALPESWMEGDPALGQYVSLARASGLAIHTMFIGFDGQSYVDPVTAARTVGLGVPALRARRLQIALA